MNVLHRVVLLVFFLYLGGCSTAPHMKEGVHEHMRSVHIGIDGCTVFTNVTLPGKKGNRAYDGVHKNAHGLEFARIGKTEMVMSSDYLGYEVMYLPRFDYGTAGLGGAINIGSLGLLSHAAGKLVRSKNDVCGIITNFDSSDMTARHIQRVLGVPHDDLYRFYQVPSCDARGIDLRSDQLKMLTPLPYASSSPYRVLMQTAVYYQNGPQAERELAQCERVDINFRD